MAGEGLFPSRKIQDIEFDMILGTGGLPVTASIYAFDTPTKIASREAISKGVAELALIKRQKQITEKELIKIQNPRNDRELKDVLKQLYNDADDLVKSVNVRVEAMRMELLSTGKIKVEENGVKVELDYKVPSGNQKSFNWSASTAKPLDDLTTLADAVEDKSGVRPTRMLTSRKIARAICSNTSVRKAIFGSNSDKVVTLAQLNDLLSQMQLPMLATYEGKYKKETAAGYSASRYYPEDKISMFADGTLGETIWGLTAEEIELMNSKNMDQSQMVGNIYVGTYSKIDPVAKMTKSAATALPTLPHGEELGIATITL